MKKRKHWWIHLFALSLLDLKFATHRRRQFCNDGKLLGVAVLLWKLISLHISSARIIMLITDEIVVYGLV